MRPQTQSWFMNTAVNSREHLRLFCFPYAGGGASIYRDWNEKLPPNISICPIVLPGRDRRTMEKPLDSVDDIVRQLVIAIRPFLDQPFAFFGHSMGALIAFETARQLYDKHHVFPTHFFASGKSAPQLPYSKKILHTLPDDQFIEELRQLQGTPEEVLQNEELLQIVLPRLRSDFTVCETYMYRTGTPLDCPLTVFGGSEDYEVSMDSLQAWKEHTCGSFQVELFEGNHFFIHPQEEMIIRHISDKLTHGNKVSSGSTHSVII